MIFRIGVRRHVGMVALCGITALATCVLSGCGGDDSEEPERGADVVLIDSMSTFGHLDRAPVAFPHDRHTAALTEQGQDCETCHLRMDDGYLSQNFLRLASLDKEDVMQVYHDNCITCHDSTAVAGRDSGPTTCGECHAVRPEFLMERSEMGFDRSLHQRHGERLDDRCEQCHHEYNEETQEVYYAEGEETTCRYCHRSEPKPGDIASSLSNAAHRACVGCHLDLPDAGPTECAGCHDATRQSQVAQVDEPKRLERGQEDFVLLRANNLDSSKVNTVPFSHVGHEDFNNTCRVCHHESMTPCADCHTLQGSEESEGVTLQRAMHAIESEHSCVGCHETKKDEIACAGCHSQMRHGEISERSCAVCHAGPSPDRVVAVENRYRSLDQFRPSTRDSRLSFSDSDIPDSVTIGLLSEKYEPVEFPHRQVINRLMEHIGDSKIATYFHGGEDAVCQGCHHHSPVGVEPPLCESCHGEPFNEAEPFKPGLLGAYHRQCLGCHQTMEIEEPQDCEGCHAPIPAGEGGS
ncbi:sulfate respiration complex hexadecaheme cytochrome HmcA [Gemmatimonadota bacterium]